MQPARELDVSRETQERLEAFEALVRRWNPKINLVSRSTLDLIGSRHIRDSLQLVRLVPEGVRSWADLGSGGGFPGLVVAIYLSGSGARVDVTLVEADQRKAAFLREAARQLSLDVRVIAARIESTRPLRADVVSARALAPLNALCGLALPHLGLGGIALFPKGANWQAEVEEARQSWVFDLQVVPSETAPDAAVLCFRGLSHG